MRAWAWVKVLGYKTGMALGDEHQPHGCHPRAGQDVSPEHEGVLLVSADRKALRMELVLWEIH